MYSSCLLQSQPLYDTINLHPSCSPTTHQADDSLIFDRAYCNQPVCSPSRNSFMSGRRPSTTKIWNFISSFRQQGPNWVTLYVLGFNWGGGGACGDGGGAAAAAATATARQCLFKLKQWVIITCHCQKQIDWSLPSTNAGLPTPPVAAGASCFFSGRPISKTKEAI